MYKYAFTALVILAIVIGGSWPAAAGQEAPRRLELRFEADGTVTLLALNVSIRDILTEWARQCGCHVVNATGLTGQVNVPLQFERRSQQEVLASLLRQASGYALTPRREGMPGPSAFETIYVLPTSRASQTAYTPPSPVMTPSVPAPTPGSPADEIPPVTPIATLPQAGAPATPEVPAPNNSPAAPSLPGTPSRFVPIVPVTPGTSQPNTPAQPPARPPAGSGTAPVVTP